MNNIGIPGSQLTHVSNELNALLCSYSVYYQNLRTFHWHVKGHHFFDLHRIFEDFYNDAKLQIDEVAERILTVGGKPIGQLSEYVERSQIDEARMELQDEEMVEVIRDNLKTLIGQMRNVIDLAGESRDEGTVDVLGGMLSNIEKQSWMLGAWQAQFKRHMQKAL